MKKIILLITTVLFIQTVQAQLNLNFTMNPKPVANIADWTSRRDVITLIATQPPQGNRVRNVKINTTIKTADGTGVAVTDMQLAPVKPLLQGGPTVFNASDVINMQALVFSGRFKEKISRTGKLPAGNYQITVQLDSTSLPVALSNTQTRSFFLTTILPILIMPANESVLPASAAQTAITFRWTALAPAVTDLVHYRVQVFEVGANQTPMQALRSNQPLLDKEVTGSTQYIWQPQLSFVPGTENKFVWTVQTFDALNQVITGEIPNGEGRSEAKTFTISSKSTEKLAKRVNDSW